MKALVLHGNHDIRVEERPEPEAGPGEVVVTIHATGICGSDFHGYSGENGRRHPGQIMGHETVGHVAAVGDGVTEVAEGDLVTIYPVLACGECEACTQDHRAWCADAKVIGVAPEIQAAFADAIVVPEWNIEPLPEGVAPELGALVEPLAVGYHAAVRGGVAADDRVLVIGGGPIGQACILGARRLGATSIAVTDLNPRRRALCEQLGARTIDPTAGPVQDAVVEALGGKATVVLDAVGISRTLADAIDVSTLGARIVLVGMGAPTVELSAYGISTQERSIIGSFCYGRKEFDETAAWVGTNPPGIDALIDGRVGWDGAAESFESLATGTSEASKILVFPHGVPGGQG